MDHGLFRTWSQPPPVISQTVRKTADPPWPPGMLYRVRFRLIQAPIRARTTNAITRLSRPDAGLGRMLSRCSSMPKPSPRNVARMVAHPPRSPRGAEELTAVSKLCIHDGLFLSPLQDPHRRMA